MQLRRSPWLAVATFVAAAGFLPAQESTPPVEVSAANDTSAPASESRIQQEIARTEADLAALEALEQTWTQQDEAEEAELERQLEQIVVLEAAMGDAGRGDPEIDEIFDDLEPLVRSVLADLASVIHVADRPSELPDDWRATQTERVRISGLSRTGPRESVALRRSAPAERLEDLERKEKHKLAELRTDEIERRLDSIDRHVVLAGRIWNLRLTGLRKLPAERRSEVFSLEGEGLDELDLELQALELIARIQTLRLRGFLAMGSQRVGSFVSVFKVGALALKILAVLLVWRWVQRNRERYLTRLRTKVAAIENRRQRQRAESGVEFVAALAPWGIFLLMLAALNWTLGEKITQIPTVTPLLIIAAIYGVYRLLSDIAVEILAEAMRRAGIHVSEDFKERLSSRVRWILRVSTVVAVVLAIINLRIGKGVLYAHLATFGWTLIFIVFFLVLGGLKDEIADLYLATKAHGRFAEVVRRTRHRWTGRLVAPITFLWLSARSLFGLVRGLAFSFRSTRAASTYLTRRRLEKTAERDGYASGRLEDLPPTLVAGLDSTVTMDDLEHLDRIPGMQVVRDSITAWREAEAGGSFLLAGDEGVGKRAWVSHLVENENIGTRLHLESRLTTPPALRTWLAENLLNGDGAPSREELISRLEAGSKRAVVIERAERLFLGTVNGYQALAELGPIVDGTRHKIFWILSVGNLAWNHLKATGKDLAFLRGKTVLEPWSEEEVPDLIRYRLAQVGSEVSYASLVTTEGRHEDREARNRYGEQAYMDLLWNFAAGNPKVALHFFARSLEPGEDGVLRVCPPRTPSEDELEEIGESALFILAAIARHGSLTPSDGAQATDFPNDRVQARLIRLKELGVVTATAGSYRVTTAWRSTVLSVLRRHNILVS